MAKSKKRWGLILFLVAVVLTAVSVYLSKIYPPFDFPLFYSGILPVAGLITSVMVIFAGHFSYPRIHNKRVYVCGYLCGFIGLVFFVLVHSPFITIDASQGFFGSLLLVQFLNLLIFPLLPSYVKYRSARSTMMALITVDLVFLLIMRFAPSATDWVRFLWFYNHIDFKFWIGPAVFILVGILSIWRVGDDFFFGGVISGCALFYAQIWVLGIADNRLESAQMILFAVAPLYLIVGILVHGFYRMENRISYDPLLQIYNREFCSKIISEQSKFNTSPPFAVAMVDIDHFKNVNDTYGHQAGDAVLYSVAQSVSDTLSSEGVVCRYGGEELAVFFPQKTVSQVAKLMENVRMGVEKIKTVSGKKKISVTISVGVSGRENQNQSIMDVIYAADKALYRAKNGGRNLVKSGKVTGK